MNAATYPNSSDRANGDGCCVDTSTTRIFREERSRISPSSAGTS